MRYYITIFALAPAVSLLPFEHVQAHYLRIDSNKEKSLQYDSTHDEYGRRLRSRQLSTPIGHGWAFGEDSKEQAPRAAAAAVEKGDKATPMGHGWAIGEDEKKEIVTAHVIAAAAAAALDGDKVHTPMGHGWSFEGPAKGMDVAFP